MCRVGDVDVVLVECAGVRAGVTAACPRVVGVAAARRGAGPRDAPPTLGRLDMATDVPVSPPRGSVGDDRMFRGIWKGVAGGFVRVSADAYPPVL